MYMLPGLGCVSPGLGAWRPGGGPGLGLFVGVGSADALGIAMAAANNGAPTHAAMMLMNFFMEVSDLPVHIGFPGSTGPLTRW